MNHRRQSTKTAMRIRVILLACALVLPATASFAAEQFKCVLVSDDGNGGSKLDTSQYYVALSIDNDVVSPPIQSQSHLRLVPYP
jgi:hypothetical protein